MAHPEEARDPSMEEILASIRKIIAEDGPEPQQPTPRLTVVSNEVAATPEPEGSAIADVDESLGEKLARKANAERDMKPAAPRAPKAAEDGDLSEGLAAVEMADASAELVAEPEPEVEPDQDGAAAEETVIAEAEPPAEAFVAAPPMQAAHAQVSPDPTPVAAAMAVGSPQQVDGNDRLLSPQADKAVHSAFNQLASTIMNDQARTIEDLVKDMMRPMLQNWLDDNLPVLVERLVREEIERVSRGRR